MVRLTLAIAQVRKQLERARRQVDGEAAGALDDAESGQHLRGGRSASRTHRWHKERRIVQRSLCRR